MKFKRLPFNPETLKKSLEEGREVYEILEIPFPKLEEYHKKACLLMKQQEYKKGADAYFFLTTLSPKHPVFWLGLGLCEHQNHEHELALSAYSLSILYDPENPLPYYQMAALHFERKEFDQALNSVRLALSCAKGAAREKSLLLQEKILSHHRK